MNNKEYYQKFVSDYDKNYNNLVLKISNSDISQILKRFLLYTPNLKGKLLRSLFAYRSCEIFGIPDIIRDDIAVGIEIFQSFTLIHDDLPALDNDDFRRGNPTLHKVVGEANAILIGDALSLLTFMIFTENFNQIESKRFLKGLLDFVNKFSSISIFSLIDGQILDILNYKIKISEEDIFSIYKKKTGALFGISLSSGAIIKEEKKAIEDLHNCGLLFGLAFQLADDLEDYQKEKEKNFNSFSSLYGIDKTKKHIKEYLSKSIEKVKKYDNLILLPLFEEYYYNWSKKYGIN